MPAPDRSRRRILLIEDEPGLVLTVSDWLQHEGYDVEAVGEAPVGLERAAGERWDAILLDIMLPGGSGYDLCRNLRQRGVTTPIIMLTARGRVVERVLGLELGADDYVTKPFDLMELTSRIKAQIRRASIAAATDHRPPYRFGDVVVDFRKAEVTRGGEPVDLSARELRLLEYLIEHREAALTREELLNEVWGYRAMPTTRTVDVHVATLRQKIETNPRQPQYLLTLHGIGYKFVG